MSNWYLKIISEPYNYYALLFLLIIGFFGQLDYTDRWGCILSEEAVFSTKNILFTSISVTLILTSFLLKPGIFKINLVILELTFWVFKLFYFKGGYLVSIAAAPDPMVSFYDSLTLSLRLFIISGLLQKHIKTIYILISTLTIIAIKVFIFPTQLNMTPERVISIQKETELIFNGYLTYLENNLMIIIDRKGQQWVYQHLEE